jgi:hypothetical protein
LSPTPTPVAEAVLESSVYTISNKIITGIDPRDGKNSVEAFLANISYPSAYTIRLLKFDGTPCDSLVGTGCTLSLMQGNTVKQTYTVVLYGDANGDGRVNSADLNGMFEHVLGRKVIQNTMASAIDVDHSGRINSADLNVAFNHVLGKLSIIQISP